MVGKSLAQFAPPNGASQAFATLVTELQGLVQCFFPAGAPGSDPAYVSTPDDERKAAALLVLAHSEVQSYVQQHCSGIVKKLEALSWQKDLKLAGAELVLYRAAERFGVPEKFQNKSASNDFWLALRRACTSHHKVIKDNNGVKEANLCQLFLPLGFAENEIGAVLISELDWLGGARGDTAHQSRTTVTKFAPSTIESRLVQVVTELQNFEAAVTL